MKGYKTHLFLLFVYSCMCTHSIAQPDVTQFKEVFQVHIVETSTPVKIDGKLDDDAWTDANIGTNFWQKVPFFAEGADPKTEVMLTYDKNNLYVAAKCYQKQDVIIQSLKRDQYWDSDGIAIILDPLNTRTNAYLFGVSAVGVQWDALREGDDINSDWSNKWYSETHITDEYWSMEMAIPLRILKFSPESNKWGMNFVRNHINENEYHNWTAVPESFWPPDPAFAGSLVFDKAPTPKKGNFNIIPFVTSSITKLANEKADPTLNAGLDARVAVSPTLNLDLTINPDFSQIEVDELVTNLTRFSIFLPEKRTFFLENSDLFAGYGYPSMRPFFSRTIGLDNERLAVPILYGARLTGNLSESLRLGVMNIHSLKSDNTNAQNQSAISMQKLFGRSFVKGMFLNRQGFNDLDIVKGDYGRNTSVEAAYISDNGQLSAWTSLHHSFKKDVKGKNYFVNSGVEFRNPNWQILLAHAIVQKNYYADMGFIARIENYDAENDEVVRLGYNEFLNIATYRHRPQSGIIFRHVINLENQLFRNIDMSHNEWNANIEYQMAFRSTAELGISYNYSDINLLYPFSFVSEGDPLPADRYKYSFLSANFKSDERKLVSYEVRGRSGGFYNGKLNQANANINFRVQPWGNLGFGYQWNRLDFPEAYGKETITALLSKLEIGFNRNLLWTTLFQFLDQSEYMGINSRLQWRFAPMSDIFLVFVDNYDVFKGMGGPRDIQTNNRALILKVNYWY